MINQFLKNPESRSIKIDIFTQLDAILTAKLIFFFASLGFITGLIVLVRAYKSKSYIFDDSTQTFKIQTEKSHKTLIEEYSFQKIQSLYIKESSNEDENIYTLFIKLADGRRVQVSSNLNKIEECEDLAKSICTLLRVNVKINPKWFFSQLRRRAKNKSHPVYLSMVD